VAGFGELVGYGLRFVSGRAADRTRAFWPIAIFGYVIQMLAVPALALAGSWPVAAALLVLERTGRAIRNPPRDVMLSHAGTKLGGYGWAFGLHEALDQSGAMVGPLVMAVILARGGRYQLAFGVLLAPALVTLALLAVARLLYPRPEDLEKRESSATPSNGLPRVFWIYFAGAGLVGAGFADYALVAFHFQKSGSVPAHWVPILYAIAMGSSGAASLLFGRALDRYGLVVLAPLTLMSALFAPLSFFGGFGVALAGVALWGLGTGVHEAIIPAAVAPMVPRERRASAYGLFSAGYGLFWFFGSSLLGALYDHSVTSMVIASLILELAALPFFLIAWRRTRSARS
jgi:predicted MFS family arabinose efflux permease